MMKSQFIQTIGGLALAVSLAVRAFAADPTKPASPLAGTWRWSFTNADGGVIQPTLRVTTADDGTLTGISRFRSGTSTPVTNFTFNGDQVGFEVMRTRNGETALTRYRGIFKGDKITGKIISGAAGEERNYDWNADRFNDIEGVWKWRLGIGAGGTNASNGRGGPGGGRRGGGPGGRGEITLTLKREAADKLSGKINLGRADQDILHAHFRNGDLSFQTSRERADGKLSTNYYWGRFAQDTITGKFTTDAGGVLRTNAWNAARAE